MSSSGGADEGGVVVLGDRDVEATDDSDGDAVELVHDGLGGGGQLVGEGHDGDLEVVALGVDFADVGAQGVHAADADGDVGEGIAPGTAEGVGDDDRDVGLAEVDEAASDGLGGGAGVEGEESDGVATADVGGIDTGVGADPAVSRFADDDTALHAEDAF